MKSTPRPGLNLNSFAPQEQSEAALAQDCSRSASDVLSSISQSMKTEVGKFFFDILKWVLIFVITLILASYFPGVYRLMQPQNTNQGQAK
jgi:hypothetical protein